MYTVTQIYSALLVASVLVMARPSEDSTNQGSAEAVKQYRQSILETADPIEHRSTEIEGARSLVYYGGARGMYLILLPSGESYISDKPVGRVDTKDKDEEDVGMEESDTGEEDNGEEDNDSVVINEPPQNASVAEAKPVGLAIAGVGGVASSKPIATAVVGPQGLAVARPIATAIAGVQTTGPVLLIPEGKSGTPNKVSGRKPIDNDFLFQAVARRIAQSKLTGV